MHVNSIILFCFFTNSDRLNGVITGYLPLYYPCSQKTSTDVELQFLSRIFFFKLQNWGRFAKFSSMVFEEQAWPFSGLELLVSCGGPEFFMEKKYIIVMPGYHDNCSKGLQSYFAFLLLKGTELLLQNWEGRTIKSLSESNEHRLAKIFLYLKGSLFGCLSQWNS